MQLSELLEELLNKCITYFDYPSISSSPSSTSSSSTTVHTTHHVHHHTACSTGCTTPSLAFVPSYPATQTVVINNNSCETDEPVRYRTFPKEKKTDKEDTNTENKIVSIIGGVGLSFLGTYLISQDRYIKYYLSGIQNDMYKINLITTDPTKISSLNNKFTTWRDLYLQKVKSVFYGKICALMSGFVLCGGYYFKNKSTMLSSVLGLTVSGCFLLWKWLTDYNDTMYNKSYTGFREEIINLQLRSTKSE